MVNVKFANLHFHSTYSDAQFTPEQLVLIGKSIGYHALALTDHDTDGGVRPMMEFAKKEGIDVISGCEFTGVWNDEGWLVGSAHPSYPDCKPCRLGG